ncbi:uncharacterized protein LOC143622688 [Bidens hawaiensis]|uniref:uncharacterized protein LOC143622688 n=1 Tax=Bidens hawaiensis TaxID=980011 RepID=UPI00404B5BB8
MEKEIRTSVKYASTAQEIWADLKERFGKDNAPRAYELKQALTTIKQEGTPVSAYFTKLRSIWDEIQYVLSIPVCNCNECKCGIGKKLGELKDKERLYEFLLGLDNEFGTIHTQILAMQPIPSSNTAYHLVFDDEQQRSISSQRRPAIDSTAFQAFVQKKKDQNGHNKDSCFKRIGYPEWWPGKGKQEKGKPSAACVEGETSKIPGLTNEQYQQFVKIFGDKVNTTKEENAPVSNMAGNIGQGGKWIIDSGATEHIIYNDFFLKSKIKKHYEPPVVIPNGDSIAVEGRGEHVLPNGITIMGVLHVPEFKCNLLSVSKLSQELQCAVTFFPDFCVMQDLSSRTLIGVGDCKKGLYKMGMTKDTIKVMMTTVDTWHNRLGHASNSKLAFVDFHKNARLNQKFFVILVLGPSLLDYLFLLALRKRMLALTYYIVMCGVNIAHLHSLEQIIF